MGVEKIAQKAAEKLAVLAAMTDEQREQYRQQRNNTYFRLAVSTLDFIFEMDEQDQIALLRAAYTYNKTGKTTEFKSKSVNSAFNHVIKPQLDIDFDNYCIACYTTEENGRKGARIKWVQERMYQKMKDKSFYGDIDVKRLIKDDAAAWQELRAKCTGKDIEGFKKAFEREREQAETEYTELQEKTRVAKNSSKKNKGG